MPSSAHKRILTLRDLLARANRAYFVEAESIMTDSEDDGLLVELLQPEEAHPPYPDPTRPSRRLSGEPAVGADLWSTSPDAPAPDPQAAAQPAKAPLQSNGRPLPPRAMSETSEATAGWAMAASNRAMARSNVASRVVG